MRLVLAIVTVVSTVGFNFHVILPLLASDTLHAGPEVFGILSACFGGGALVGALLSAALGRASWKALVAGTGGFSVSLLALAPLATVWACALLLFVTGVCFTLWTANANTILQLRAPDHLRGRVVSLYLWAFAGLRADRRPARRLALRARRHAAQLRGRRRDRARDDRCSPPDADASGARRFTRALTLRPRHADDLRRQCAHDDEAIEGALGRRRPARRERGAARRPAGLALPGSLGNYFFGPKLVRAEVLDQGRRRSPRLPGRPRHDPGEARRQRSRCASATAASSRSPSRRRRRSRSAAFPPRSPPFGAGWWRP